MSDILPSGLRPAECRQESILLAWDLDECSLPNGIGIGLILRVLSKAFAGSMGRIARTVVVTSSATKHALGRRLQEGVVWNPPACSLLVANGAGAATQRLHDETNRFMVSQPGPVSVVLLGTGSALFAQTAARLLSRGVTVHQLHMHDLCVDMLALPIWVSDWHIFLESWLAKPVAFPQQGPVVNVYDSYLTDSTVQMHHNSWVCSVAFSPDGRTLASCSINGGLKLWDARTGTPQDQPVASPLAMSRRTSFSGSFSDYPISTSHSFTMGGAAGGGTMTWDGQLQPPSPDQEVTTPRVGMQALRGCPACARARARAGGASAPSSPRAAAAAAVALLNAGEPLLGEQVWEGTLRTMEGGHTCGTRVGCGTAESIAAFSTAKSFTSSCRGGASKSKGGAAATSAGAVAFHVSGQLLAVGSRNKGITLWCIMQPGEVDLQADSAGVALSSATPVATKSFRMEGGHYSDGQSLAFLPQRPILASTAAHSPLIRLWELDSFTGRLSRTLNGTSGWDDGDVSSMRQYNGVPLGSFQGHTDWVTSIATSPTASWLVASASYDRTVRVWDVRSGRCITRFADDITSGASGAAHAGVVSSVAVSADGFTLVSGGYDGLLKTWDLRQRQRVSTLAGHAGRVTCCAFAGSDRIVSGSDDGTALQWDASSGACVATLANHASRVMAIAASTTSGSIATGSQDHTIQLTRIEVAFAGSVTDAGVAAPETPQMLRSFSRKSWTDTGSLLSKTISARSSSKAGTAAAVDATTPSGAATPTRSGSAQARPRSASASRAGSVAGRSTASSSRPASALGTGSSTAAAAAAAAGKPASRPASAMSRSSSVTGDKAPGSARSASPSVASLRAKSLGNKDSDVKSLLESLRQNGTASPRAQPDDTASRHSGVSRASSSPTTKSTATAAAARSAGTESPPAIGTPVSHIYSSCAPSGLVKGAAGITAASLASPGGSTRGSPKGSIIGSDKGSVKGSVKGSIKGSVLRSGGDLGGGGGGGDDAAGSEHGSRRSTAGAALWLNS